MVPKATSELSLLRNEIMLVGIPRSLRSLEYDAQGAELLSAECDACTSERTNVVCMFANEWHNKATVAVHECRLSPPRAMCN